MHSPSVVGLQLKQMRSRHWFITCKMLFHSPAVTEPTLDIMVQSDAGNLSWRSVSTTYRRTTGSSAQVSPLHLQSGAVRTELRVGLQAERVQASVRVLSEVMGNRHEAPLGVEDSAR